MLSNIQTMYIFLLLLLLTGCSIFIVGTNKGGTIHYGQTTTLDSNDISVDSNTVNYRTRVPKK